MYMHMKVCCANSYCMHNKINLKSTWFGCRMQIWLCSKAVQMFFVIRAAADDFNTLKSSTVFFSHSHSIGNIVHL